MNFEITWASVLRYEGRRPIENPRSIIFTIWFVPEFNPTQIIPILMAMGLGGVDMIERENAISITLNAGNRALIEDKAIILEID
jgi:hypothetical protein